MPPCSICQMGLSDSSNASPVGALYHHLDRLRANRVNNVLSSRRGSAREVLDACRALLDGDDPRAARTVHTNASQLLQELRLAPSTAPSSTAAPRASTTRSAVTSPRSWFLDGVPQGLKDFTMRLLHRFERGLRLLRHVDPRRARRPRRPATPPRLRPRRGYRRLHPTPREASSRGALPFASRHPISATAARRPSDVAPPRTREPPRIAGGARRARPPRAASATASTSSLFQAVHHLSPEMVVRDDL